MRQEWIVGRVPCAESSSGEARRLVFQKGGDRPARMLSMSNRGELAALRSTADVSSREPAGGERPLGTSGAALSLRLAVPRPSDCPLLV
jgi:hypothetical protein